MMSTGSRPYQSACGLHKKTSSNLSYRNEYDNNYEQAKGEAAHNGTGEKHGLSKVGPPIVVTHPIGLLIKRLFSDGMMTGWIFFLYLGHDGGEEAACEIVFPAIRAGTNRPRVVGSHGTVELTAHKLAACYVAFGKNVR